ncbi:MAG TPA: Flp pilus assembly protein CpaB [Xanthobacteraceae bacterium]
MQPARIFVLMLALAAGGVAAYLAGRSGGEKQPAPPPPPPVVQIETVDVLVAASDLGVGTSLSSQDMRWQVWPAAAAANFIRKNERPNAVAELSGAFSRQPISAGEPIRESRLIKGKGSGYMAAILPEGMRAVATDILPESSAGGFILPNDHVDVILTRRDRHAEKITGTEQFISSIVIANVRVLAIDQHIEEKSGGDRVIIGRTATLELTPGQAESFMRAKQMGSISLALRSIADFDEKTTDVETSSGRNPNMVRFGMGAETAIPTSGR